MEFLLAWGQRFTVSVEPCILCGIMNDMQYGSYIEPHAISPLYRYVKNNTITIYVHALTAVNTVL